MTRTTDFAATVRLFAAATIVGGNYAARRHILQQVVALGAEELATLPSRDRRTLLSLLARECKRYFGTHRHTDGTAVKLVFTPSQKYSGGRLAVWYYEDLKAAYAVALAAAKLAS